MPPKRARPASQSDPAEITPSPTPKPMPGDKIAVDSQGSGNAVAAGRGARAWVVNIYGKWWLAALLLAVFILVLGVIAWQLWPKKPALMSGLFNVAVSSFQVEDKDGKPINSTDGYQLADFIQKQVSAQFREMQLDKWVTNEVWGPQNTGTVTGRTPAEQENSAKGLAESIHATVLIYGTITANGPQSRFEPHFYVNHQGFHEADEITGESQLGAPLKLALPFANSIQPVENPALAGRTNAIDLITIGLAYYSVDDFENALVYFQKAADDKRWLESAGKEVIYLLIGNANVRQSSKRKDPQYLPAAAAAFTRAIEINADYGRGLMGQGNVLYLQALGDASAQKIDPNGLAQAEAYLKQALALEGQPASANLSAKAHYLQGQIYLARMYANLPNGDWKAQAETEFTWVVHKYEGGDNSLSILASHAYVRLGALASMRKDWPTAVDLTKKGIALASPFFEGEYTAWLGSIFASAGETEKAIQAYQDAMSIAEANSDAEAAKRYSEMLKKVKNP